MRRSRWQHHCQRDGHVWWYRIEFGPGELRNFAICTRCGAMDGEYFTSTLDSVELRHGRRND